MKKVQRIIAIQIVRDHNHTVNGFPFIRVASSRFGDGVFNRMFQTASMMCFNGWLRPMRISTPKFFFVYFSLHIEYACVEAQYLVGSAFNITTRFSSKLSHIFAYL